MTDTVSPEVRSRMMAAIRAKDTQPELAIRRGLHALGFRYVLHSAKLPGRPDMVLPRYRAVVWVHGCYWHGHGCSTVKPAATNESYWSPKIVGNRERDARNLRTIEAAGWRSLVVWECAFRRKGDPALAAVIEQAAEWLREGGASTEIG